MTHSAKAAVRASRPCKPLTVRSNQRCSRLTAATLVVLTTLWAESSQAQNCETMPDTVRETYPASGSRSVPLNGLVRVLYCSSEQPLVDRGLTRLLRDRGDGGDLCECEAGTECLEVGIQLRCLEEVQSTLTIENDEVRLALSTQLEPHTTYVIEAPEPSEPLRLSFVTGTVVDSSSPEFSGIESVRIVGCGEGFSTNAACPTDLNGEGFTAILQTMAAADEAGAVNVEYRAYQVRGEELIERGRVRGDGAADVTFSIFIPSSELTSGEWERLCFSMSAVDPYSQESTQAAAVCEFTPEFSPFGSACAVGGAVNPARGGSWPLALLALMTLVMVTVFSRRSRRR